MAGRIPPTSRHGHDWNEVTSSFQKTIRRGDEEAALYFMSELYDHGHEKYVWKRLLIMVSEDIGLAEPFLPAQIRALYDNWLFLKKEDKGGGAKLPVVHATLLMARARKSRIVDHATVFYFGPNVERREPPDYGLDKHTIRGKRMGRGWDHFWEEGTLLADRPHGDVRWDLLAYGDGQMYHEPIRDPYRERAILTTQTPGWDPSKSSKDRVVNQDNGVNVHQVVEGQTILDSTTNEGD
jgi:hypothetical protein